MMTRSARLLSGVIAAAALFATVGAVPASAAPGDYTRFAITQGPEAWRNTMPMMCRDEAPCEQDRTVHATFTFRVPNSCWVKPRARVRSEQAPGEWTVAVSARKTASKRTCSTSSRNRTVTVLLPENTTSVVDAKSGKVYALTIINAS